MKQLKIVISVILAAVLVLAVFTACKGNKGGKGGETVTVAVTDENGEAVTDENGEVVTEVVNAEDTTAASEGEAVVIEGDGNDNKSGDNSGNSTTKKTTKSSKDNKKKDDKETTKKNKKTVKKPAKPAKPANFKATGVTKDSLSLSWDAVKCDAYELEYKESGKDWKSLQKSMTSTKANLKEYLKAYTLYYFRVRAFNENSAGKSASDWVEIKVKTKADEKYKRFISVKVKLPFDSKKKDKVRIYIKKQGKDEKFVLVNEKDIICDGSNYKYKTDKKYEGVITVKAVLVDHKKQEKVETNGDSCEIDLSTIGIDVDVDDEDI